MPDLEETDMSEYAGADTVGKIVDRHLKTRVSKNVAVILAVNISELLRTRGGLPSSAGRRSRTSWTGEGGFLCFAGRSLRRFSEIRPRSLA